MARLQSYPLPVRVCLAVLDLCWALATLELRRIFDLLLLLDSFLGATRFPFLDRGREARARAGRVGATPDPAAWLSPR